MFASPYPFDVAVRDNLTRIQLQKLFDSSKVVDESGRVLNRQELVTTAQKTANASKRYLTTLPTSLTRSFLRIISVAELFEIYVDSTRSLQLTAEPSELYTLFGTAFGVVPIEDLPLLPSSWVDTADELFPNSERFYRQGSGSTMTVRLVRSLHTSCGGDNEVSCSSRNFPNYWDASFTRPLESQPPTNEIVDFWAQQYARNISGGRQQVFVLVKRTNNGVIEAPSVVYKSIDEEQLISRIPAASLPTYLSDDLIIDMVDQINKGAKSEDESVPVISRVTPAELAQWRKSGTVYDPESLTVKDLLRRILDNQNTMPDFDSEKFIDDLIKAQENQPPVISLEWMCGIEGTPDCSVSVDDSGFEKLEPLENSQSLIDDYVDNVLTDVPECTTGDCSEANPWGFSMDIFMPDLSSFTRTCQNPDISLFGTSVDIDICDIASKVKPLLNFLVYFLIVFNFRRLFLSIPRKAA